MTKIFMTERTLIDDIVYNSYLEVSWLLTNKHQGHPKNEDGEMYRDFRFNPKDGYMSGNCSRRVTEHLVRLMMEGHAHDRYIPSIILPEEVEITTLARDRMVSAVHLFNTRQFAEMHLDAYLTKLDKHHRELARQLWPPSREEAF